MCSERSRSFSLSISEARKMKQVEASFIASSLRVALQLIDRAVARFDASGPTFPDSKRIHLVRAMVEILEVIESLHASQGDPLRKMAAATSLESSYNELFRSAVTEAQAFESEGNFQNAANRYLQFLEACQSHIHRALARSELERLQRFSAP